MSNPKKPARLKVIAGTDQPCRRGDPPVELPLVDGIPSPPDWLPNIHAVAEWQRLAPILAANRLLNEGGIMAFGHLCSLHGKLVAKWASGDTPTGHMLAQYRALINDFGLTPVAQGRVRPGGKEDTSNPYARRPDKAQPKK